MTYYEKAKRATRHGWKVYGTLTIGNAVYTTFHRANFTIAIHPLTARMFAYKGA